MKRTPAYLLLGLALLTAPAATAQQPPHQPMPMPQPSAEDPIGRNLFPPELIMQHGQDISLSAEQRATITKAIQDFQTKTVDLQWRMQDQTQRLAGLVSKPAVDETAALQQLDEVLNVEREVKRAHIGLLLRIKNTLTPAQQAALTEFKLGLR